MLDILQQIRGYSPNLETADQTVRKSIPIVGDQLTVECGVNVIQAVQNAYTLEEKLEGIHMEIADWHTAFTFLNVRECSISIKICTLKIFLPMPNKVYTDRDRKFNHLQQIQYQYGQYINIKEQCNLCFNNLIYFTGGWKHDMWVCTVVKFQIQPCPQVYLFASTDTNKNHNNLI